MNHQALKAELEKRAKVLIAKRDGQGGQSGEVEEGDGTYGSDQAASDRRMNVKGMSMPAIRAELEKRAKVLISKRGSQGAQRGEVEEDDESYGSDQASSERHVNVKSMSTDALRAELEKRAAEWKKNHS